MLSRLFIGSYTFTPRNGRRFRPPKAIRTSYAPGAEYQVFLLTPEDSPVLIYSFRPEEAPFGEPAASYRVPKDQFLRIPPQCARFFDCPCILIGAGDRLELHREEAFARRMATLSGTPLPFDILRK
ncbi:MAG: hypothetical protein IKM13_03005 [Clostridia bacterium]|nr:hypothetical protein [Clostridia bacterium]